MIQVDVGSLWAVMCFTLASICGSDAEVPSIDNVQLSNTVQCGGFITT